MFMWQKQNIHDTNVTFTIHYNVASSRVVPIVRSKGRFPLPEFTGRVDGPSSRAVNSARELGPWTRVVETDLKPTQLLSQSRHWTRKRLHPDSIQTKISESQVPNFKFRTDDCRWTLLIGTTRECEFVDVLMYVYCDVVGVVAVDSQSVREGALWRRVHRSAQVYARTHRGQFSSSLSPLRLYLVWCKLWAVRHSWTFRRRLNVILACTGCAFLIYK